MPATAETCPGLSFWLTFVESEGALCEDAGDHSLVLLPERLSHDLDLPEETVVTADPMVAREDGSLLLAPGHPLLNEAAERVIARGDVGTAHLPWPATPPPSATALESHAREQVAVDHGRIDVMGHPMPAYLPVLRVGVLVSYAVSLDESFLEQEEVLVDATTGLALSPAAAGALAGGDLRPGRPSDRGLLAADLDLAVSSAHGLLEPRVAARLLDLGRQSGRGRQEELDRASAYYQAALEAIARRRETATTERQAILEGQAVATRVERDRRLAEIEETFRPVHELRPYRLHLLGLPAVVLPVDVRRGPRRFPAQLVWIPSAAGFVPRRCPSCSSSQPWVAGKERLGCRGCQAPPVISVLAGGRLSGDDGAGDDRAGGDRAGGDRAGGDRAGGDRAGDDPGTGEAGGDREESAGDGQAGNDPGGRASPPASSPAGSPSRPAQVSRTPAATRRAAKTGRKLALELWQAAMWAEQWPSSGTAPGSPLAALHRLFGAEGPLVAVGVGPGERPGRLTMATAHSPGQPVLTTGGLLVAGGVPYPYTLRWQLGAQGTPIVAEVLPSSTVDGLRLPRVSHGSASARRLGRLSPTPLCPLDDVGEALWETERARHGLAFAVRCLAAWWRLQGLSALSAQDPAAVAAGLATLLGRRSRLRISERSAGQPYGVDKATTGELAGLLSSRLGPTAGLSW